MQISAQDRTIAMSIREFSSFSPGPQAGGSMPHDPLRAQLGQSWHEELRRQTIDRSPGAQFEVSLDAPLQFRGWHVRLTGRIDQLLADSSGTLVREVKTVMRPLPIEIPALRLEYPAHFVQLAAYQCLHGRAESTGNTPAHRGELVFVEPATGIVQVVVQSPEEAWRVFEAQLDVVWSFAEARLSGLQRLRSLQFAPAFANPRPGQETIMADLRDAASRSPLVLFEAPTGFGKTGCALEYALHELKSGRLTRLVYLTGKSTGQIQVVKQLQEMVGHPPGATWWQIRNKAEHCINDIHHCFRDACGYLAGQEERWPTSGLQRFGQDPALPRDLETLRAAGREARICPYEITRAALPFTDIWIADYNYVFAPQNRGFFGNQPGFEPGQTLLIVDEAHNLPSRVADAYSSELTHEAALRALGALDAGAASPAFVAAWERLTIFLGRLEPADALGSLVEAELLDHLGTVNRLLPASGVDFGALGPSATETIGLAAGLHSPNGPETRILPELIWSPASGVAAFTCLDASAAIAETLREFGHALFLSATLSPIDVFSRQCGFDALQLISAHVPARTPWRDCAYRVAVDSRVDTRYDRRNRYFPATAEAIVSLHGVGNGPLVAFFPSFTYARHVMAAIEAHHPAVRAMMQPRARELAAQHQFLEEALVFSDIILLVLGSSFAESIDILGGRVAGAVVVGPALPEVNAVQRARLDACRAANREDAFRQVYQIPGMQKVNQALGRLVRAPGQHARVLLHCRRFAEASYQSLLAPEYRDSPILASDSEFQSWLHDEG